MQFKPKFNHDYTVINNSIFRERGMSFKTKGLLAFMFSLPDTWDYSIRGLVALSRDGRDAVNAAIKEAEQYGYLVRYINRSNNGCYSGMQWDIYQEPQGRAVNDPPLDMKAQKSPCLYGFHPQPDNPFTDNPVTVNPLPVNQPQSITNILSIKQSSTQSSSVPDIIQLIRSIDSTLLDDDVTSIHDSIIANNNIDTISNLHAYIAKCVCNYKARMTHKPKKSTQKNKFNNFSQRTYDYSKLEKEIINN